MRSKFWGVSVIENKHYKEAQIKYNTSLKKLLDNITLRNGPIVGGKNER
jgi:hypothetical protein